MRDRGETRVSGTAVQTGPSPIFEPRSTGPTITGPFVAAPFVVAPFDVVPFDVAAHSAPPRTDLPRSTPRLTMPPPAVPPGPSFPTVEELKSTWSIEPNLSARGPAYTVMRACLAQQASAAQRGRVARMLGRSPLHPDARSWYRGALGEVVVSNVLSQLGPEWTVLHAVPVGQLGPDPSAASTIDHVILGPGGIFTINTKNHSGKKIWVGGGTFLVNGFKEPYMRSSVREAEYASRSLSSVTGRPVVVTPVIVVVNPASITTGRKPPRVAVLASDTLKRWLVRRPRVLSDRAVAHFSMFAEERSTWRAEPVLVDDAERHVQAFERLRAEVDAARQRGRLWLLTLGVVAILCAPLVTVAIMRAVDSLLAQTGN